MDALAAECEAHWAPLTLPMSGLEGISEDQRVLSVEDARLIEAKFGREQSDALRQRATEAIAIIDTYTDGGSRHSTTKS